MWAIDMLIRKCCLSLIINKGEGYQRKDLLDEIQSMLDECLELLEKD